MRICDLATATDLVCRREMLLQWLFEVKRDNFSMMLGRSLVEGPGLPEVKRILIDQLQSDLDRTESNLAELGVEVDDAEATPGLSPIRVEASCAVAATS